MFVYTLDNVKADGLRCQHRTGRLYGRKRTVGPDQESGAGWGARFSRRAREPSERRCAVGRDGDCVSSTGTAPQGDSAAGSISTSPQRANRSDSDPNYAEAGSAAQAPGAQSAVSLLPVPRTRRDRSCHCRSERRHHLPTWFARHLYGSHVIDKAESAEPWRDLMLRYRAEWLIFAEHARKRQLIWADLVMPLNAA
jgi:hypothetical protein